MSDWNGIQKPVRNNRVWRIWNGMKNRCRSPKSDSYHIYGARGITVCERWQVFRNFFEDMGHPPTPSHSLDRINNDLGYQPDNCRWASVLEQQRNRRDNAVVTFRGETRCGCEWDEVLGFRPGTTARRMRYGWTAEEAIMTPINPLRNRYRKRA